MFGAMRFKAEVHTNRERAAALLRAERRVQEREKWLEGEQQELDQTRDRVGLVPFLHYHILRLLLRLRGHPTKINADASLPILRPRQ